MNNLPDVDLTAWIFILLYLLSLIGIGFIARNARKENSLKDFYLGGQGFGFLVLFLTFFATQYSGNTFFAFTGATYRLGYFWTASLHFMTAVVIVYLIFAPKLHVLAKKHNFLTPSDYIMHRYHNKYLSVLITLIMIIVLCNFTLAQLMAMGRAMQGLSSDGSIFAYKAGVIGLALIMVIYGTLGGIRAIAWTDALQGTILLIGFFSLLALMFDKYGTLEQATKILIERDLSTGSKYTSPPGFYGSLEWLSYILAVGFGISLYPQAIQRIYAAKNIIVLKKSLATMVFMPLPTMLISIIAGIFALAYIPGLSGAEADQAFGTILRELQNHSFIGYGLVILTLSAVLAAMMSTADSALLSMSSMITKDIIASSKYTNIDENKLTLIGKCISWSLISILIILALLFREDTSLVRLMDRKLDLLLQLVPAFILGIRWKTLTGNGVLLGILVGLSCTLIIIFGGYDFVDNGKVHGLHPGLIGLIPNLMVSALWSLIEKNKSIALKI